MQWIEVCIKTTSQAIELVGERLTMLGFDSFIMDDQDEFHEFLENNKQYWDYVDEGLEKQMQGLSQIRLYLEDSPAAPETISYLKDQLRLLPQQYPSIEFGTLDVSLEHVKDEDWENNWKQYYQPLKIGSKLLVVPEWLHPENPEHRVEVLLDPGMIFGTGAHASTQMCMEELERAIQGGEEVLDLGSGSGILSITALLLGAEHATGVDIDPKAEDIARQNAAIAATRKSQVGTGDRSGKIRTYNFPQNRVTDHRLTGDNKNFNIAAVMNGDLDPMIDALILNDQAQRLQESKEE